MYHSRGFEGLLDPQIPREHFFHVAWKLLVDLLLQSIPTWVPTGSKYVWRTEPAMGMYQIITYSLDIRGKA